MATPAALVACTAPVTEPPPLVTLNVTETPVAGAPDWLVTTTVGATGTGCPAVADCVSPAPLVSVWLCGDEFVSERVPFVGHAVRRSARPETMERMRVLKATSVSGQLLMLAQYRFESESAASHPVTG